jgi:hypothetical protein
MPNEIEKLLTQYSEALKGHDRLLREWHSALQRWADVKGDNSEFAKRQLPGALAKVSELQKKLAASQQKVKGLGEALATAQSQRNREGALEAVSRSHVQ